MANSFQEFKTQILDPICLGERGFYNSLTESQQKGLAPLVLMRWLSGTSNEIQIQLLNEVVNPYIFPLFKEKKLLIYLLQTCSPHKRARLSWKKTKSNKTSKISTVIDVLKNYYGYNTLHAQDALPLLDDDTILQCAGELGYQPDDIKQLKKELRSRK